MPRERVRGSGAVDRAADRRRAARPGRPRAAAGQAARQGLGRGGERQGRARAGRAGGRPGAVRVHERVLGHRGRLRGAARGAVRAARLPASGSSASRRWRSTTRRATPPAARSSGSRTPACPATPARRRSAPHSLPAGGERDAPGGSRVDLARVAAPSCGSRSGSRPDGVRRRRRAAPTPRWAWRAPARATACCCCVTPLPCSRCTCLRLVQIVAGQTVTVLAGQGGSGSRAAVAALAAAIDARDNYTLSHSKDVVDLAGAVAKRLGLSDAEISQVRDGAMLHDVGKVAIPNEILNKPRPARRGRVEDHARAPRDRRADPPAHARAGRDRAARAPRARALGRQRLSRRPGGRGDPDRQPDHPRLRRLQRDDHRAPVPRADGARRRPWPSCGAPPARSSTRWWWARCSTS